MMKEHNINENINNMKQSHTNENTEKQNDLRHQNIRFEQWICQNVKISFRYVWAFSRAVSCD